MSRFTHILRVVVGIELAGTAILACSFLCRQRPPAPDLGRLDRVTAAELNQFRDRLRDETPTAWRELADRYLACGFFPDAELCYRQAAARDPNSFDTALHWAIALDRLGQTKAAITGYQRAIELASPSQRKQIAVCWCHIGRCRLREEKESEAELAFREADDAPLARIQLARMYAKTGRYQEALPLVDQLLATYPNELIVMRVRGQLDRALGQETPSADPSRIEQAVDRAFLDSTIEFLGTLREKIGLLKERMAASRMAEAGSVAAAADRLRETLDVEWDAPTTRILIQFELRLGHADKALRLIAELEDRVGNTPESLEQLGDAWRLKGDYKRARQAWERALAMRPYKRSLYLRLAEIDTREEKPDMVERHQNLARREQAIEAFRANDLPVTLELLVDVVRQAPDDARAWFYLAEAQRLAGKSEEARRSYRRCLEIDENYGRALEGMSRL